MRLDSLARLLAHEIADADPVIELIGRDYRQDRHRAAGMGGAHGGEPHGVETFAAVVEHHQKLAHDPIPLTARIMARNLRQGNRG